MKDDNFDLRIVGSLWICDTKDLRTKSKMEKENDVGRFNFIPHFRFVDLLATKHKGAYCEFITLLFAYSYC